MKQFKNKIIYQTYNQTRDSIINQITIKIEKQIYNQLKHSVRNIINNRVYDQIWFQVNDEYELWNKQNEQC